MMESVFFYFENLESTNAWAKANMELFQQDKLTVVWAKAQTKGRGQYGRQWISPSGMNIYASFCFVIKERKEDPLSITHILAISICQFLKTKNIQAKIKWPNDIKVNDKKIAGILCETTFVEDNLGIVVGLGLNVNMPFEFAQTIDQPATSLFIETGKIYSLLKVLNQLTFHFFSPNLDLFLDKGFDPFAKIFDHLRI